MTFDDIVAACPVLTDLSRQMHVPPNLGYSLKNPRRRYWPEHATTSRPPALLRDFPSLATNQLGTSVPCTPTTNHAARTPHKDTHFTSLNERPLYPFLQAPYNRTTWTMVG